MFNELNKHYKPVRAYIELVGNIHVKILKIN